MNRSHTLAIGLNVCTLSLATVLVVYAVMGDLGYGHSFVNHHMKDLNSVELQGVLRKRFTRDANLKLLAAGLLVINAIALAWVTRATSNRKTPRGASNTPSP